MQGPTRRRKSSETHLDDRLGAHVVSDLLPVAVVPALGGAGRGRASGVRRVGAGRNLVCFFYVPRGCHGPRVERGWKTGVHSQVDGLEEQVMLLVRPRFPRLGNRVRLARLAALGLLHRGRPFVLLHLGNAKVFFAPRLPVTPPRTPARTRHARTNPTRGLLKNRGWSYERLRVRYALVNDRASPRPVA